VPGPERLPELVRGGPGPILGAREEAAGTGRGSGCRGARSERSEWKRRLQTALPTASSVDGRGWPSFLRERHHARLLRAAGPDFTLSGVGARTDCTDPPTVNHGDASCRPICHH
jgi:hypothetical protein